MGHPDTNPVIVFDGMCMLCAASIQFVLKHDRSRRFRLTTAQSARGRAAYFDLGLDPDSMPTMIVIADGRALTESDAVLAVLGELGWPWRVALVSRVIPRSLRNAVYRWIARHRYRWFAARVVCWRPTADLADRMLESDGASVEATPIFGDPVLRGNRCL